MEEKRFAQRIRKGKKVKIDMHFKFYIMDDLCKKTGLKKGNKLSFRRIGEVTREKNKARLWNRLNLCTLAGYLQTTPRNKKESYYILGKTGEKILKEHGSFLNFLNYKLKKQAQELESEREIIEKQIIVKENKEESIVPIERK